MPSEIVRAVDYKALYRKLEQALDGIEGATDRTALLESVLRLLVHDLRDELGFVMGRLYRREGDDYILRCAHGGTTPIPLGRRVPRGYPPHERTLKEGIVVMRRSDGGFDDEFERAIGVDSTFAAVAVGPANSHVLAFTVSGEIHEREILYSLTAVRHVINLKLEERKLSAVIQEARIIQEYLLPASNPSIQGYEVAGRSRPAEVVGGDVYDFFPLRRGGLGLAIADVSGHGLPAALLARDIVTGLRLTAEDGLPVARTVERLNRLIHRSSFSSRFVSLFLVHGTPRGRLTYCNAGHNPPLATRAGALRRLEEGGLVLGPDPTQPYAQGRVRLLPQDKLLLYTDGLVEQRNPLGEEFGLRRLENVLREGIALSAREMVDAVFAEVDRFANRTEVGDDQTVVVLRKSAD